MRIGIRGHDLEGTGIEALVKGLKENGLDALQLVYHKSFEDVPYTPEGLTAARAVRLLKYSVRFATQLLNMRSALE